jgi:hypothetical protein
MAASKKAVAQAKSMAASGASAKKIENKTGVSSNRATALVAKNTPMPVQPKAPAPAQTKGPLAIGVQSIPSSSAINVNKAYSGQENNKASFANAGANISKNEALKIAEAKDISVAQVMDRALDKGRTLGASLVNQYNAGKLDDRSYIEKATDTVFGKMGADTMYQPKSLNTLDTFGKMPQGSVYGGMTSAGIPVLGTKMPKDLVNAKPKSTDAGAAGTPMPTTPSAAEPTQVTPDFIPPEIPEEEEEDPMMMPGVGADVSSFATGWKSRLSSRKRQGSGAQGLASQRLGPVGKWQYNV